MFFYSKYLKAFLLRITLLTIFLISGLSYSSAQDYGWWNDLVKWDGRSHWSEYMIYTPKFFGPNAIPVPEIKNGLMENRTFFEFGMASHYSNGDDTQNILAKIFIPVAKQRVGLQLHGIPYERYQMTPETRDLRRARDFDGKGFAFGDLHLGTWIQLTNPDAKVDLLLTLNLKTASGSNREATRYTDGSGYNFDLSIGKSYLLKEDSDYLRPHAQIGFYVWETNEDRNPQNDAFSFGLGTDWKFGKSIIKTQVGGYIGYKGNGDKPVIARFNHNYMLTEKTSINAGIQYGFRDNLYRSFFLSIMKEW